MLQTLRYIPHEIAGVPVLGFGLLFYLFVATSVVLMAWLIRRQGLSRDTWSYVPLLVLVGAAIVLVLPRIAEPEGLPIRGYGVMLLVAIVSAVGMAAYRGRRLGVDPELIVTLSFWMIVPGLVGARLFYVIEYWHDFQHASRRETLIEIINITQGGLVVYGSFVGGILGFLVCLWIHRLPKLAMLDLFAPSAALGSAIGRIGCFLNGCCFGGLCDLPWAVTFPPASPAFVQQLEQGEIFLHGLKLAGRPYTPPVITEVEPDSLAERQGLRAGERIAQINGQPTRTVQQARWLLAGLDLPGSRISLATADGTSHAWTSAGLGRSRSVHPTQLYSAITDGLICLFLLAFAPFRRKDGEVFALLATLHPITRFFLEIIRTDESAVFGTGMSISQNISLVFLLAAAGLWIYLLGQPARTAYPKHGVH